MLTFISTRYKPLGPAGYHKMSDWEVYGDATYTQLVASTYSDLTNLTTWTPPQLANNTQYFARVRHVSSDGIISEWSPATHSFTTTNPTIIAKPTFIYPAQNATGVSVFGKFQTSAYTLTSGIGTHESSDWEIYSDAAATQLASSSYTDTSFLTGLTLNVGSRLASPYVEFWARVRYTSNDGIDSPWSDLIHFETEVRPLTLQFEGIDNITMPTSFTVDIGAFNPGAYVSFDIQGGSTIIPITSTGVKTINIPANASKYENVKFHGITHLKNFVVDANTRMASIISWGDLAFTSFESMFKNVKRRTSAPALKPFPYDTPVSAGVTSMASMFENSNIGVNPSDWDLSACTSLRSAFANYRLSSVTSQIQAIDVSGWSVAPLTDVQYAFDSALVDSGITGVGSLNITGCTSLLRTFAGVAWAATEDFSGLDTSNITNMNQVFSGCATFTGIGLENWNVSKVTNMAEAFKGATVFNGNISGWDTGAVTTMESLFNNAIAFNQSISGWDTSSVTTMNQTFFNAKAFNQALNLWDTSSVTNFYRTFYGASAFNKPLDLWLVQAATNMQGMFYNATAFNQNIKSWCVTNIVLKPADFDSGSAAWVLPVDDSRPVWGGSPCVAGYYTPIYKPEQFSYTITGNSTKIESVSGYGTTAGVIDWGDGTTSAITTSTVNGVYTHNYPSFGNWVINITNAKNIKLYVRSEVKKILNWGSSCYWTNFDNTFTYLSGLTNVDATDTPNLKDPITNVKATVFNQPFYNSPALVDYSFLDDWDLSGFTTMTYPFSLVGNASTIMPEYQLWDMTIVTNATGFFANYKQWPMKDISGMSFPAIDSMAEFFRGITVWNNTTQPNISAWNVSNIKSFRWMFGNTNCNPNIAAWNVTSATTFEYMFAYNSSFNIDISSWKVGTVTNMTGMFDTATAFNRDLRRWCVNLITSKPFSFDTSATAWVLPQTQSRPIWGCLCDIGYRFVPDLTGATIFTFNSHGPNTQIEITLGSTAAVVDWGDGTTTSYTGTAGTTVTASRKISANNTVVSIKNHTALKLIDHNVKSFDQWGTAQWTSLEKMFFRASSLQYWNATDQPNLTNCTSAKLMFGYLTSMTGTLDLSPLANMNVSNITNMSGMFGGEPEAYGFYSGGYIFPDFSSWNVSKVTDMSGMFAGEKIRYDLVADPNYGTFDVVELVGLGTWDVSKVTNMQSMFKWPSLNYSTRGKLFNMDNSGIGNWNTSSVTNMSYMFYCGDFNIDISNWDVSNVRDMYMMFTNCRNFNKNLSKWCVRYIGGMPTMFDYQAIEWAAATPRPNWGFCPFKTLPDPATTTPLTITTTGVLANENIQLNLSCFNGGRIDWGDGVIEQLPGNWPYSIDTYFYNSNRNTWYEPNYSAASHTYTSNGNFTIKVYGANAFKLKHQVWGVGQNRITGVTSWGNTPLVTLDRAFEGCTALVSITAPTAPPVAAWGPTGNWSERYIRSYAMFSGCTNLNNVTGISNWDVSRWASMGGEARVSMQYMFNGCTKFNQNLSNWCVSHQWNKPEYFDSGCTAWTMCKSRPQWGVCPATQGPWVAPTTLGTPRIYKIVVANEADRVLGQNFTAQFPNGGAVDFGDGQYRYYGAEGLFGSHQSLNHDWCPGTYYMKIYGGSNIYPNAGNFAWGQKSVKELTQWGSYPMYHGGYPLGGTIGATVTATDKPVYLDSDVNMGTMFGYMPDTNIPGIETWDVSNVRVFDSAFQYNSTFNKNISGWKTTKAKSMGYMFYGCTTFNQNLSGWCVGNIATAPNQFAGNATAWTLPKPVWGTCPP